MKFYIGCTINVFLTVQTFSAVIPTSNRNRIENREKLSLLSDWNEYNVREPAGPGTYSFGYDVEDSETANVQFRSEDKLANGTVTGSYGYVTPEGNIHIVHYTADHLGYRTIIENGGKTISKISYPKKNLPMYNKISPQMNAALMSLENSSLKQKIKDQHKRPIDDKLINNNKYNTRRQNDKNGNNHTHDNNYFYNVYHVPASDNYF